MRRFVAMGVAGASRSKLSWCAVLIMVSFFGPRSSALAMILPAGVIESSDSSAVGAPTAGGGDLVSSNNGDGLIIVSDDTQPRPGDTNGDGRVDTEDLMALLTSYDQSGDWATGDFNGDGLVDFDDLTVVLANFSTDLPGGSINGVSLNSEEIGLLTAHGIKAVPEPRTLALLSVALLGFLAGVWRKQK